METIKQTGNKVLCRIPKLSAIDDSFVAGLKWPEGVSAYYCLFREPTDREWESLGLLTEHERVWIVYSAEKDRTVIDEVVRDGILHEAALSDAELAKLFTSTRKEYYRSLNREMSARQIGEQDCFIKNALPGVRRICLEKSGTPVALMMLVETRNYEGVLVDWVPWAWIAASLGTEDRRMVHQHLRLWLGTGGVERVQCSVASHNFRSQKFFRKMGFRPECAQILKEK